MIRNLAQKLRTPARPDTRAATGNSLTARRTDDVKTFGLSPAALSRVLSVAKIVRFSRRDVIYRAGDAAESLFALRSGMVKLVNYLPNGRARTVRLHVRGSLVGLNGLLGEDYEHTAVVINDVVAYRIPIADLQMLREDDPQLYGQLTARWYDYLREADAWITQFSTGSTKARVARLIVHLSNLESDTKTTHVKLLTCEEMADVLGVTMESVSRMLALFKRKQLLHPVPDQPAECYGLDWRVLNRIAED